MRKNSITGPNVLFSFSLNEKTQNFDIVENPDLSALKGIRRKKTFDNFWIFSGKFTRNRYTRQKEKYLEQVFPLVD
jgi:hypothetical protein